VALSACCLLVAACGIKSYPVEKVILLPVMQEPLEASPVAGGVEVGIWIPGVDKPDQRIVEARLYYAYIPVTGVEDCPPCPPRLTKYLEFDLTKHLEGLEGGYFKYLDTQAPFNKQAVYNVVLTDAAGRQSTPSPLVRAYRVTPPATPKGFSVQPREGMAHLTWKPVEALADGSKLMESVQYLVDRKGPDGERRLTQRHMSAPPLEDKTVMAGQTYSYRVVPLRSIRNTQVLGEPTPWVSTALREDKVLEPPSGLVGVSQAGGIYLRFTPSPTQDTAGYFIERQDKKGGGWSRLNAKPWLENTFVDKDVQVGAVYLYRVTAVDEAGQTSQPCPTTEIRHQP
jgi:fibronectin type 3 domain-containing protein